MSVIRITKEREAPYVMLDKTALKDKRLSFRAKGLHAYLMSKPDDWTIHIDDLAKQSPSDGRDAVAKGLKDLEACGYIRRQRLRDASGRMAGWDTIVYETPWLALMSDEDAQFTGDEPKPDLPTSVIPVSVHTHETIDMSESTPKPDLPKSVIPLLETPKPDLPKTVLPNSANPSLLNKDTTQMKETTDISPEATSPSAPTKKGRQKVSLPPPEELIPSEKLISWHQREFPQYDLSDAIEACLDHYRKKGQDAANYEAAIRNWFRTGRKLGTLKPATTTHKPKFVE